MEVSESVLMMALEYPSGCKSKTGILRHAPAGGEEKKGERTGGVQTAAEGDFTYSQIRD